MCAAVPRTPRFPRLLRLAAVAAGLTLLAGCAANEAPPNVTVQQGGTLAVEVPDSANDAGRAVSVALDADGNPSVAYLMLVAKLTKGALPPPVIAGQPQPPAVMLATLNRGVWSRQSVTPQSTAPAQGKATGISFKDGTAGPPVETGLVVDAQGKHHVAWSASDGVYYDTDATGSFGDPQKIAPGQTFGAALALAPDGSPWVSYYSGTNVQVAHQAGSGWTVQTAASNGGPSGGPAVVTAIGVASDGTVIVAYGADGSTAVARQSASSGGSGSSGSAGSSGSGIGAWSAESVPGQGGYGVSMALDGDGNPHLAYYDRSGGVHHATSSGSGPWTVDQIGPAPSSASGPDATWGTGIAVDQRGDRFVTWTDPAGRRIMLAIDRGGSSNPQPVPNSQGGATPSIAVSQDGRRMVLAWYDTVNGDLKVGLPPSGGLALAFSPSPPAATSGPSPAPSAGCKPSGTTVNVAAKNIAFDTNCLAAPAGKAFTISFDNQDSGVPHNVEVFTDSSGTQRLAGAKDAADIAVGPDKVTYDSGPLKAGTYFFRCDVHPTQMTGTFVVA